MGEVVASGGVVIPSSPIDRQKIKTALTEVVNAMTQIKGHKDYIKETVDKVSKDFNIPKSIVSKLAKTMYKSDYAKIQAEYDDFESLYEVVVEGAKKPEKA